VIVIPDEAGDSIKNQFLIEKTDMNPEKVSKRSLSKDLAKANSKVLAPINYTVYPGAVSKPPGLIKVIHFIKKKWWYFTCIDPFDIKF